MAKKIFKFLTPVLTILGLFIVLLVLSSVDDDDGCCEEPNPNIEKVYTNIIYFNKSDRTVSIGTVLLYKSGRSVSFIPDDNNYDHLKLEPLTGMKNVYRDLEFFESKATPTFSVDDPVKGHVEVSIVTYKDKCEKLPILIVWDGSTLKAAQ